MRNLAEADQAQDYAEVEKALEDVKYITAKTLPELNGPVERDMIAIIHRYMKMDSQPKLQYIAAWCLSNLTAGRESDNEILFSLGSHEYFLELLVSQKDDLIELVRILILMCLFGFIDPSLASE